MTMTYDLDRTILELEAEFRNAHTDERRQIEAELQRALEERLISLAELASEPSAEPPF
jgi:hypothetical protein